MNEARFLVVGAHAVAFHARPRRLEGVDLLFARDRENADRLAAALEKFGVVLKEGDRERFAAEEGRTLRVGRPPNIVDLHNSAHGVPFDDLWARRVPGRLGGAEVAFPAREDLIALKRAAGRPDDLADLDLLERTATRPEAGE